MLAGAALVILLTVLEGSGTYNGAGSAFLNRVLAGGRADPWAFLLKMAFTALTLGAGFRGGEIVPTFFIGAAFGSAVAPPAGAGARFRGGSGSHRLVLWSGQLPPGQHPAQCGAVRGRKHRVLCLGLCSELSAQPDRFSLYSSQKLVYSKLEPRYIDASAR